MVLVSLPVVLVPSLSVGQAAVMQEVWFRGWLSLAAGALLRSTVQAGENCVAVGARVRTVKSEVAARIV